MRIIHDLGKSVSLCEEQGATWLRYCYDVEEAPKPFCYPLGSPAGYELGAYRPADHMWHRGLWFTWKYVNGVNYWEEEEGESGKQLTVGCPVVEVTNPAATITLSTELEWRDREPTIRERRILVFHRRPGLHLLDWEVEQTALRDLVLDRREYTTWGGYGGLVVRAVQSLRGSSLRLAGGETVSRVAGEPHAWCDLSGQLDGGPDRFGGVAFLDHPSNPRHPVPFYARSNPLDNFMNAAFLFHEPLKLPEGERLHLRYRVLIHDGLWEHDALADAWNLYAAGSL